MTEGKEQQKPCKYLAKIDPKHEARCAISWHKSFLIDAQPMIDVHSHIDKNDYLIGRRMIYNEEGNLSCKENYYGKGNGVYKYVPTDPSLKAFYKSRNPESNKSITKEEYEKEKEEEKKKKNSPPVDFLSTITLRQVQDDIEKLKKDEPYPTPEIIEEKYPSLYLVKMLYYNFDNVFYEIRSIIDHHKTWKTRETKIQNYIETRQKKE